MEAIIDKLYKPESVRSGSLPWRQMAHRLIGQLRTGGITDRCAQLSYYFFFAIFPLMLSLTALLGFIAAPGTFLHSAITHYFGAVLPGGVSGIIENELTQISTRATAGKLSLGLFVALWSASQGMSAIISSLNLAYGIKRKRPWWREKLLAIGLTLVVSVLLLLALAVVMYGGHQALVFATSVGLGHEFQVFWKCAEWPILFLSLVAAFSLIYYFAPNLKHKHWRWIMPGTVIGVALWVGASLGFRLYLTFFNNYSVAYGSIGAIIILLLWFYLTGIALLVGGEVNSAVERALGNGEEFA